MRVAPVSFQLYLAQQLDLDALVLYLFAWSVGHSNLWKTTRSCFLTGHEWSNRACVIQSKSHLAHNAVFVRVQRQLLSLVALPLDSRSLERFAVRPFEVQLHGRISPQSQASKQAFLQ